MAWKCGVCNFIWEGDSPPVNCPKCGAPAEKFVQLSHDEKALIERSRKSNSLHIELLAVLPRLLEIAEEGIKDDLDPRCVTLFKRLQSEARFLTASAKAELEGHMKKNKWG
ncbi:MAG: rubredoxin [Syntrophomonadaceae bacterium]|jgi:hypothetical protein|nr:rubredoxin [Syntrophomonadaceae bacterium]